ncbi:hypothetical protein MMPV_007765 [Pyropia vietnamensis]
MAKGGSTPYPTPPYPQLRVYPTIGETIAGFRAGDWAAVAGVSAVSAPFGYYIGKPTIRMPSVWMAVALGASGALAAGMQASFWRLTGYAENGAEAARFGLPPETAPAALPTPTDAVVGGSGAAQ